MSQPDNRLRDAWIEAVMRLVACAVFIHIAASFLWKPQAAYDRVKRMVDR
jgi:hypothetical protein